MNLLKKLLLTAFSRGLSAAGTLGLNVVLARCLEIGEFGNISVCLVAVVAISIFCKFGFDTSLLRFGGAAWHQERLDLYNRYCKSALLSTLAISLLVLALVEIALRTVPIPWAASELMKLTMLSVPFLTVGGIFAACLKAAHRPELGTVFEMGGASSCACVILLGSAFLGWPITMEFAAEIFVFSSAVFCLAGWGCWAWSTRHSRESHHALSSDVEHDSTVVKSEKLTAEGVSFRVYLLVSLDFLVVAVAQVLGNWSGVFFLDYHEGEIATAVFSAARRTSLIPLLLIGVVVSIFSPKLAGLFQMGDQQALKRMVHRSSAVVCLVNVPVLLTMCLGAPWWMGMFGAAYRPHWLVLALMSAGQLVGAITGIAAGIMAMTGSQRQLRRISIVSAIIATFFAALLTATMGLLGAAIAAAGYAAGQSLLVAVFVRKQLGYWPLPAMR